MNKAYSDPTCAIQIIGNALNDSQILENLNVRELDFVEEFHKIVFGAIYNIYSSGSKVTIESIIDYLENRPKYNAIFKQNNGKEYLLEAQHIASKDTLNYYYNRLKKLTLLRIYDHNGIDVTSWYDPDNILDTKKRQAQEDWLDTVSLVEIADEVSKRVDNVRMDCVDGLVGVGYQAGDGIIELIEKYEKEPEMGIPLYGELVNTVFRGARLKKFFLRSAATNMGKTRMMVADACNFASPRIYDERFGWINNGAEQPTLIISTEMDKEEMQRMMLAFLSNVEEDHIKDGHYFNGERDRVIEAAKMLKDMPLWIEFIPDFSLQDIENTIKRYIREYDVLYICFDYIMTSLKILEEITSKSGGVRLREDNILFMLSTRLKDLANQYGVFIESSTQLSGDWRSSETPDQNLLRGAKSLADKVDGGSIILPVSQEDIVKLDPILRSGQFPQPNIKMSIYKNRAGKYKGVYLWGLSNMGTCRTHWYFCTTWEHELIPIQDMKIIVQDEDSAWRN